MDTHPFEKAGLGRAPFQFIGMSEKVYVACPGAPEQPAGTCDYCGNGIRYVFHIRSADGKEFGVGCDCVRKTDKACLLDDVQKKMREVKRAADYAKREKKWAEVEKPRIDTAFAAMDSREEVRLVLASKPHPCDKSNPEKSLLSYIEFCRRMAGRSGLLRIAKMIEDVL